MATLFMPAVLSTIPIPAARSGTLGGWRRSSSVRLPAQFLVQLPSIPFDGVPARRIAVIQLRDDGGVLARAALAINDLPLLALGIMVDDEPRTLLAQIVRYGWARRLSHR